jgi:oligoribonuclease NrnB/cAMP/cGMP phosphodiesterase (DHH superfamily)
MEHALYCSDQIDGICSAAIVARALRLAGKEWHLGASVRRSDRVAAVARPAVFYILDIPPSQLQLIKALVGGNKVAYWCSDEVCTPELHSEVSAIVMSGDLLMQQTTECSAEMCMRRFLPHDATAQQLAAMAHDIKQWKRADERAQKLADVIAAGFNTRQLIDMLSKGVLWSEMLEKVRADFMEKKSKALAELTKYLVIKEYVGKKFGFTLAQNFLPSAEAGDLVLGQAVDVAVVLYRDGRIIFRRRDGVDVNLLPVARLFNGGGRLYAAGGQLDVQSVSSDNFEHVLFAVDRTLKDFFLK